MADVSGSAPESLPTKSNGTSQEPPIEPEVISKAAEYLRPLLRDPNQAVRAVTRVVAVAESFSGPMPHPRHLKGYEEIVPGSAREMLSMAQKEQSHRHRMQSLEMVYPYLGWFAGFVGLLACVILATYLGMNDHDKLAGGMLGVPSLGVIGWFIHARLGPSDSASGTGLPAKPTASRNVKRKNR
jgi:uncharacterized membrane protein